jgi:hypothetical protein
MADDQGSPKRPLPGAPAIPPFRRPGGQSHAPSPLGESRRSAPPFIGARPATSPPRSPNVTVAGESAAAPPARPASRPSTASPDASRLHLEPEAWGAYQPPAPPPSSAGARPEKRAELEQPSAELPWLDVSAEQVTANANSFPPFDAGAGEDARPEETAQALAGLPYFDGDGDQHTGREPTLRSSGKMHRVEFDLADVLERVAARIRDGGLAVPHVDPLAGEGAAIAAVLAALLRQRGR